MEPQDLRRVVVPLLLIQLIFAVIGWFRRTCARNLSHLLSTVALSLASSLDQWLSQAIALAEAGWNDLAGQLSLSLPWALRHDPGGRLEMGIPRFAIALLKLFGAPLQPRSPANPSRPGRGERCRPRSGETVGTPLP